MSDGWQLGDDEIAFVKAARVRFKAGLPATLPGYDHREIDAELLLNEEVFLEALENPLVLTFLTMQAPLATASLAAANRLMARARPDDVGVNIATYIADSAPHKRVRDGVGMVVRYRFAESSLQGLRYLSLQTLDDDRRQAREELVAFLARIGSGAEPRLNLVSDLMMYRHRLSLSGPIFSKLVLTMVDSPKVAIQTKLLLIENLEELPQKLQYAIITRLSRLRPNDQTTILKDALEQQMWRRRTRASDTGRKDTVTDAAFASHLDAAGEGASERTARDRAIPRGLEEAVSLTALHEAPKRRTSAGPMPRKPVPAAALTPSAPLASGGSDDGVVTATSGGRPLYRPWSATLMDRVGRPIQMGLVRPEGGRATEAGRPDVKRADRRWAATPADRFEHAVGSH